MIEVDHSVSKNPHSGKMKEKIRDVKLVKAAGIVSLGTLFSRVTGLIRLQVIAFLFGYSQATDAFWLAFTLPNLLRALLAEGALSTAFIPVFSEWYSRKGEEQAWRLASNILNTLILLSGLVVAGGIICAPLYLPYFGVGFRGDPHQMGLAIQLTQFMWPFLMFMSLGALAMAILNCRGQFDIPAFAPLFFNVSLIAFALIFASRIGIYSLAIGVIVGGLLQLLVQVPSLVRRGFKYQFFLSWREEGVRKVFRLILPAILGSITLQVSVVITRIFASTLPAGGISGLQYAMRLIQFPLGLFPIAISTVIFPRLSSLTALGDKEGVRKTVGLGMRMVFFLLLPSMMGLIVIRKELISLLFQYGAFSQADTLITSGALLYYSFGLFAMGGVMILTRAFYSLQDVVTPLKIFLASLALNVLFNFLLIGPLQHKGLALSTSLSVIFNMSLLAFFLRRKLGGIQGYSITFSFLRTLSISLAMGGVVYLLSIFLRQLDLASSVYYQAVFIVLSLAVGMGMVAGVSYLLRIEEFKLILRSFKR